MCQVKDNKIDVTALLPSILPHLSTQAIVQYQYSIVQYSIVQHRILCLNCLSTLRKPQTVRSSLLSQWPYICNSSKARNLKHLGLPLQLSMCPSSKHRWKKKKKCLIFKHLGHKKTIILAGFVTPTSMLPCLPLKESAYASPRVEAT